MPPNSARVTSMVRAPRSAARRAASTPAGPAPITMVSIIFGYPDDEEIYPVSMDIIQCREVSKRLDAREEEVGAASHGGEGRQAGDFFADRALRDFVFERAVLSANDRVAFVAEFMEVVVVHPYVLCELELADEARADHEGSDAAFHAVLWRFLRQMWAVGGAAADHAAAVHIVRRVAGIHSPHVRAERYRIAMGIHLLIVEVVVALRIGTERRIVLVGCQHQRCAAAPAAHQLCCNQFLFFGRLSVLAQEVAELADMLLQAAISHIAAVAGQNLRLWQIGGRSVFVRVAEDEFAGFEQPPGPGSRNLSGVFHDRLGEPVAVPEMVMCIVEWRRRLQVQRR